MKQLQKMEFSFSNKSWPIIVELISVWKRLNEFEKNLDFNYEKLNKEKL